MVSGEVGLLNSDWFDVHFVRRGDVVIFQRIADMILCHFGELVGDEIEDVDCRFILGVCLFEVAEFGKKCLASVNWDAVDDGVIEGGGQCVGVEKERIVEGSYTLDVRFQCVDGWNQLLDKFLYCLQWLI